MNTATVTRPTTNRFADNTTTNPVDRTRVYGFAPGLKYMPVRGLVAGRGDIGQGQLVIFKPRVETHLDALFNDAKTEHSARTQARQVLAKYAGGPGGDTGFRILDMLTNLPYDKTTGEDEAEAYFAVVHPNMIGSCEMGLETNVGGDWELSGGPNSTAIPVPLSRLNPNLPSDPCATCRLKWLQSAELTVAIENSGLDVNVLNSLRNTLIQSYSAFRAFARKKVDESKGDIGSSASGKPGKASYDEADYHYMAVIHEKAPHIQQAELVAEQARVQGEATAKALADYMNRGNTPNVQTTVSGDSAEVAELKRQLAEAQNKLAEAQAMDVSVETEPEVTVAEITDPADQFDAAMKGVKKKR